MTIKCVNINSKCVRTCKVAFNRLPQGSMVNISWLPGHTSVGGNEKRDEDHVKHIRYRSTSSVARITKLLWVMWLAACIMQKRAASSIFLVALTSLKR